MILSTFLFRGITRIVIDREDTDGNGTPDRDIVKCWGNTPTVPDLDVALQGRRSH